MSQFFSYYRKQGTVVYYFVPQFAKSLPTPCSMLTVTIKHRDLLYFVSSLYHDELFFMLHFILLSFYFNNLFQNEEYAKASNTLLNTLNIWCYSQRKKPKQTNLKPLHSLLFLQSALRMVWFSSPFCEAAGASPPFDGALFAVEHQASCSAWLPWVTAERIFPALAELPPALPAVPAFSPLQSGLALPCNASSPYSRGWSPLPLHLLQAHAPFGHSRCLLLFPSTSSHAIVWPPVCATRCSLCSCRFAASLYLPTRMFSL